MWNGLPQQARGCGRSARVAAGIIGFVDLALGAAAGPVLSAHLDASDRFRGIRHMSAWDANERIHNAQTNPPRDLLQSSKFREGFACLSDLGLSFDAWVYHPQIPEVTDLARAFPGTTIVLNHVGGPLGIGPYANQREEVFGIWRSHITQLARCPNVCVKLGGLTMSLSGFGWHKRDTPPDSSDLAEAMRPYYQTCIGCSAPSDACSRATFPSIVSRVRTRFYGTRLNVLREIFPRRNAPRYFTIPRCVSTNWWTEL